MKQGFLRVETDAKTIKEVTSQCLKERHFLGGFTSLTGNSLHLYLFLSYFIQNIKFILIYCIVVQCSVVQ